MNARIATFLAFVPWLVFPVSAQDILFDFDNAPLHSGLPVSLSSGGLTAQFSGTGGGFSIQEANTLGFTPAGFSGYCIYPNSINAADLVIQFSQPLNHFSLLYAPEEYACDSSAQMRVNAYLGITFVGTSTMTADPPGTWPSAVLSFDSVAGFDNVVVHYDSPPPTGGDWGPIFMADNMLVSVVPEPGLLGLLGTGVLCFLAWARNRKAQDE